MGLRPPQGIAWVGLAKTALGWPDPSLAPEGKPKANLESRHQIEWKSKQPSPILFTCFHIKYKPNFSKYWYGKSIPFYYLRI